MHMKFMNQKKLIHQKTIIQDPLIILQKIQRIIIQIKTSIQAKYKENISKFFKEALPSECMNLLEKEDSVIHDINNNKIENNIKNLGIVSKKLENNKIKSIEKLCIGFINNNLVRVVDDLLFYNGF